MGSYQEGKIRDMKQIPVGFEEVRGLLEDSDAEFHNPDGENIEAEIKEVNDKLTRYETSEGRIWLGNDWSLELDPEIIADQAEDIPGLREKIKGHSYFLENIRLEDLETFPCISGDFQGLQDYVRRIEDGRSVKHSKIPETAEYNGRIVVDGNKTVEALKQSELSDHVVLKIDYSEEEMVDRFAAEHLPGGWNENNDDEINPEKWYTGEKALETAHNIVEEFGPQMRQNPRVSYSLKNF